MAVRDNVVILKPQALEPGVLPGRITFDPADRIRIELSGELPNIRADDRDAAISASEAVSVENLLFDCPYNAPVRVS